MNKIYKEWYSYAPLEIKQKMNQMSSAEISECFKNDIQFGTAGMRGVIKFGAAYINEYTLARASLSYGKYLIKKFGKKAKTNGVVIAHDNRRNKILFSNVTANTLSALGIKVFFFPLNKLQPTPLLSYVIAKGNYVGGINITASHNPPEYNGFKVYDESGKQLGTRETNQIQKNIKQITDVFNIKQNSKNVSFLDNKIITSYINTILKLVPFYVAKKYPELKIIFTPQHGAATRIAKKLLQETGVKYQFVIEQMKEDSNFSNTKSPNPMNIEAFDLAREYGNKFNADILFSTDPDADRFGVMVKHKNKWIFVDGNQLPVIQIYWKLSKLSEINYIKRGDFIVRSVVTSNFADKIAKDFNVKVYETLIGFKYIIDVVLKKEALGHNSLFAWEESMGSVVRSFTRDKDSFQALVQVIEIAGHLKKQNKTLIDLYEEIEKKYGYHSSDQKQLQLSGENAILKMKKIISKYQNFKIGGYLAGLKITEVRNYLTGYKKLPKENFVTIFMGKNSVSIRPSGTEPVLRIYGHGVGKSKQEANKNLKNIINSIK